MQNGSFILTAGSTTAIVKEVHKIPKWRRHAEGAECAVLIAEIQKGALTEGDKFILTNPDGKTLEDQVARLEVNCRHYQTVGKGVSAGILLMNTQAKELTKFGLPLRRKGQPVERHP